MNQEIELKLAFPPSARAAILRHPLLKQAQKNGPAQTLINTYYDTPELKLSARRVALRTRKAGKLWLQTVKCAAESVGGLSSRPEWEQTFDGNFDFSAIEAPKVRRLLEKNVGRIVPLFSTNFRRETFILSPSPGVRIQLMIDSGEVCAEDRSEVISELELELDSGSADDLLALASELAASLPLIPFDTSKAARGYRLFRKESSQPCNPVLPGFKPATDCMQAFREAAWHTLGAWTNNHYGALHTADPEFLHQLRLSLRQMRSLIRMFSPALPTDFSAHWLPALAELSHQLAAARELEVLSEVIILPACVDDSEARLADLLAHARHQAETARQRALSALAAPGAGLALLTLSRGLHALPASNEAPALTELASAELYRLYEQARHALAHAQAEHSPARLHALRLSIKRLRLAVSCFQNLFPARSNTRQLRKLARLQKELGYLHDLSCAMQTLHGWAKTRPALREGLAFLSGWHAATSLKLRRRILPRCARLLASRT